MLDRGLVDVRMVHWTVDSEFNLVIITMKRLPLKSQPV